MAADGHAGYLLYQAGHHDVVITDILMPGGERLELIERLRRLRPGPRVIAISGDSQFSEPLYLPSARLLGAERVLPKPIEPETLLKTVAEVLAADAPVSFAEGVDSD